MSKKIYDVTIGLEISDRLIAETEEEAKVEMIRLLGRRIKDEGFYRVFWDRTYDLGEVEDIDEEDDYE